MVKRYWGVSVAGLGLGFVLGVLLFVLIVVPDLSGGQGYLTGTEAVQGSVSYGVVGVIVAAVACAGGWLAVALRDRRLEKESGARAAAAAGGAAVGIVMLGIVGGVLGANTASGPGLYPVITVLTLVLAIVSAIAAAVLVEYAERSRRTARVKPVPPVRESRWTTF